MIPKIIHQIWIQGFDSAPNHIKKCVESCARVNQGFQFIYWNEQMILDLLSKHKNDQLISIYKSLPSFASKADLARYVIMYHYGGWYIDADYMCFKPLDVFELADLVYIPYRDKFVLNGLFACVAKHPLMRITIETLLRRCGKRRYTMFKTTYRTGTNLFYSAIKRYHKAYPNDSRYIIVSTAQLFPRDMTAKNEPNVYKHIAFTDHMNTCSWNKLSRICCAVTKYISLRDLGILISILILLIIAIISVILIKSKYSY